jgi:hypothetical protein
VDNKHLENREWLVAALCGEVFGPGGVCSGWKNDLYGAAKPLATHEISSPLKFDSWREWNSFTHERHIDGTSREEIIKDEPPSNRYGVGILFPATSDDDPLDADNAANDPGEAASAEEASVGLVSQASVGEDGEQKQTRRLTELNKKAARLLARRDTGSLTEDGEIGADDLEVEDDSQALSLSRIRRPRSMGISFLVDTTSADAKVLVTGGRYWPIECLIDQSPQPRRIWVRVPVRAEIPLVWSGLKSNSRLQVRLQPSEIHHLPPIDLELHVRFRRPPAELGTFAKSVLLTTLTLVNCSRAPKSQVDSLALFQTRFLVESAAAGAFPFLPLPSVRREADAEQQSLALLYRSSPSFCHGHGCAGSWDRESTSGSKIFRAARVIAEPFPVHQVPPVTANLNYPAEYYPEGADKAPIPHPNAGKQLRIFMAPLARAEEGWLEPLREVADLYRSWICGCESNARELDDVYIPAANRHLQAARECCVRILAGIRLLEKEPLAAKAFKLANEAILLQQIAGRAETRPAEYKDERWAWPAFRAPSVDMDDEQDAENKCAWRPFQIAFLLMSLPGLWDGKSEDRDTADLIWFPTGGGKTEAYLGAAAFHMLARRMNDPEDSGTAVLMRYTLRLLTAQQFQRASGLICALELLRRSHLEELGSEPFKIGIWVGGDTTPNTRAQSIRALEAAVAEGESKYKHIVFRCPRCAAQMGPIRFQSRRGRTANSLQGLRRAHSGHEETVEFFCPDRRCDFHQRLPLFVVDEEIYEERPSLVIGTVDKFAMLAWRPEARSIFGIDEDGRHEVSPPGLIIQDELHLISGPLGSMVGLYEGLIDSLCTQRVANGVIRPKLIASTATTRASTSQIRDLYARDRTFLFPPPGLDAGDSFFATYDRSHDGEIKPGRMYVGVLARSYGSGLTVNVRVLSALMAAAALIDETERNPWHTLLVFYNSLRELGAGLSLYANDIPDRLINLSWRWAAGEGGARYLHEDRILELTGRLSNSDIPKALQALERDFSPAARRDAVDACLASNIIEVGVDVRRLGIMAVSGQPKNTAQYIQATGRVGRVEPGLVVMIYDNKKARDLSHYEHFRAYHGTLYAEVEPASVTPFTTQVLERALHGVFVAWVRNKLPIGQQSSPQQIQQAQGEMRASFEEFCDFYRSRIRSLFAADDVARDEALDVFEKALDLRRGEWLAWTQGGGAQQCAVQWENKDIVSDQSGNMPLLRRYGEACKTAWRFSTWETPTSMRGVDAECAADIVHPTSAANV